MSAHIIICRFELLYGNRPEKKNTNRYDIECNEMINIQIGKLIAASTSNHLITRRFRATSSTHTAGSEGGQAINYERNDKWACDDD